MIARILTIGFLVVAGFSAAAQAINPQMRNIRWNASSATDLDGDGTSSSSYQFVTHGKNNIDWIQKNGRLVYTLNVNGVDDTSWTNVNSDGKIVYDVSFNHMNGTLTIARSSNVISITLKLAGKSDKVNLQYSVDNFQAI